MRSGSSAGGEIGERPLANRSVGRNEPSISVIIPTYQRRDSLLRTLTALARQDLPAETFEVIVSVDGSQDGTDAAVASFPAPFTLRSVQGTRRGRAAACNAAIAAAGGEIVVILDDDMQPSAGCLRYHARHHPPLSRTCVIGAAPVRLDETAPAAARFVARKFNRHLERLARPDHVHTLRDFYSGNASIRAEILREAGGFDETFTMYGNEDLELSLRLRAAGVTLRYDGDALAEQHYDKDLAALAQDTVEKGRTAVLLVRSHPEAFGELQLGGSGEAWPAWRFVRRRLLRAARRRPRLPVAILRLGARLERLGFARSELFYRLLLDFAYWTGVQTALEEDTVADALVQVAAELGITARRSPASR
jgi:GT2 family glycosyltransferase